MRIEEKDRRKSDNGFSGCFFLSVCIFTTLGKWNSKWCDWEANKESQYSFRRAAIAEVFLGWIIMTLFVISLTVTYTKRGEFGVSIIPHTVKSTTLATIRIGDMVNLETDIIAKYIEKLLEGKKSLTLNYLKELGF